ncbi:hypothetical protein BaRGS_00006264 [Batillaria attramentaria]|uniref:Uncharacterized protein n=1 Tax=Batillaria attramentaria TaxID=370345 RepID=A0ABD0LT04_9CAEN
MIVIQSTRLIFLSFSFRETNVDLRQKSETKTKQTQGGYEPKPPATPRGTTHAKRREKSRPPEFLIAFFTICSPTNGQLGLQSKASHTVICCILPPPTSLMKQSVSEQARQENVRRDVKSSAE